VTATMDFREAVCVVPYCVRYIVYVNSLYNSQHKLFEIECL